MLIDYYSCKQITDKGVEALASDIVKSQIKLQLLTLSVHEYLNSDLIDNVSTSCTVTEELSSKLHSMLNYILRLKIILKDRF